MAEVPRLDQPFLHQEVDGIQLYWVRTMKYVVAKSLRRILSWLDFEWRLWRLPKEQLPAPDVVIVSSLSLLTILNGFLLDGLAGAGTNGVQVNSAGSVSVGDSSITGFSGQGYEGWAETGDERISIVSAVLHDHATALLTLPDGRELIVDLTGQRDAGSDGHGRAIVTLSLSNPAIAMMSPDEIRARLRLLPDIRWCAHWSDQALHATASTQAHQAAHDAMDAWGDADEALFHQDLPLDLDPSVAQQWRRETLLHSEVKAILEQASHITTPGLNVEVTRYAPDEFSGEWEDNTLRMQWMTASTALPLENTQLEQRQGSIVPDVICTLRDGAAVAELAHWLAENGHPNAKLTILERLGGAHERITKGLPCDPIGAPVSPAIEATDPGLPQASGLPDELFQHDGQITKRAVRALTSRFCTRPSASSGVEGALICGACVPPAA